METFIRRCATVLRGATPRLGKHFDSTRPTGFRPDHFLPITVRGGSAAVKKARNFYRRSKGLFLFRQEAGGIVTRGHDRRCPRVTRWVNIGIKIRKKKKVVCLLLERAASQGRVQITSSKYWPARLFFFFYRVERRHLVVPILTGSAAGSVPQPPQPRAAGPGSCAGSAAWSSGAADEDAGAAGSAVSARLYVKSKSQTRSPPRHSRHF